MHHIEEKSSKRQELNQNFLVLFDFELKFL